MLVSRVLRVSRLFLFLGCILLVCGFRGCWKRWDVSPVIAISEQGDKIAFRAGRARAGQRFAPEYSVFIHDLAGHRNNALEIKAARGARALAWRPGVSPPELFAIVPNASQSFRLVGIRLSERPHVVLEKELSDGFAGLCDLAWSPDGDVLAVSGFSAGLHYSFDGGKTLVPSKLDIKRSRKLRWMNENLLLRANQGGPEILEIAVRNGSDEVLRTVASGDVTLRGVLDDRAVYTKEDIIYRGDQPYYESDQEVGGVFTDDPYVAFLEGGSKERQVCVLDGEGNMISKRIVPRDTMAIGLSSKRKCVYLLKDRRTIQTYDFVDDSVSTIFSMP